MAGAPRALLLMQPASGIKAAIWQPAYVRRCHTPQPHAISGCSVAHPRAVGDVRSTPHRLARQHHVCAAGVGPESPSQATVTALQMPGGSSPAAYLVGVGPQGAAAASQQVEQLVKQLLQQQQQGGKDQQQQRIVLFVDPAAMSAGKSAATTAQPSEQHGSSAPLQQQQQQQVAPDLIQVCSELAAAYNLQLQVVTPSLLPTTRGASQQEQTATEGRSSSSSGSGVRQLLSSGLGLARRTAAAAVDAVDAVAQAAAAARADEEQAGVDLLPDLPDLALRPRRTRWDNPERSALSWQAALMFCIFLKQLQDQGFNVELVTGDGEEEPDSIYPKEGTREKTAATCFEVICLLLSEASGQDVQMDEEDVQQWLAVLLSAENPSMVVVALEELLEEATDNRRRVQELGMKPEPEPLPSALDVVRRLDAKFGGISGAEPSSDTDNGRDGDGDRGDSARGAKESTPRSSTPTRRSDVEPTDASAAADESSEQTAAKRDDEALSSSGIDPGGSAADHDSSTSRLAASDVVVSAHSSRQLIEAMMRLESSWQQADVSDAPDNSSSRTARDADKGSTQSSRADGSRPRRSSGSQDQPVPELLPRPVRPPQTQPDASSNTSSSSAADAAPPAGAAASSAAADAANKGVKGRFRRIAPRSAAPSDRQAGASGAGRPSDASAAAGTVQDQQLRQQLQEAAAGDVVPQASSSPDTPGPMGEGGSAAGSTAANMPPDPSTVAAAAAGGSDNGSGCDVASSGDASAAPAGDTAADTARDGETTVAVTTAAAAAGRAEAAERASAAAGTSDDDDPDSSELEALRNEFARFEEFLLANGVDLSRQDRLDAFVEVCATAAAGGDSSDDDESEVESAGEEGGADEGEDGPGESTTAAWTVGAYNILQQQDPESLSSLLGALLRESGPKSSSSSSASADAARNGQGSSPDAPTSQRQQKREQQQGGRSGVGGPFALSARGYGSGSSSGGWEQLRKQFGQDGLDQLQELLRADNLRMTGWELSDMQALADALTSLVQGDTMSTSELRVFARLLREAETDGPANHSAGSFDHTSRSDASRNRSRRQRQQTGSSSRRAGGSGRMPGLTVSAKDLPYEQDTRSVRLPKPFGRRRGERVQQLLRQLRQREQQRRLVRQQRAAQLQLWRLQQEFMQQQQEAGLQQAQAQGSVQGSHEQGWPANVGSSSRPQAGGTGGSSSSWLLEALRRFSQGRQTNSTHQPRAAAVPGVPSSAPNAADAAGGGGVDSAVLVQQLQAVLAGQLAGGQSAPASAAGASVAVVAVVRSDQLPLIEQAWVTLASDTDGGR